MKSQFRIKCFCIVYCCAAITMFSSCENFEEAMPNQELSFVGNRFNYDSSNLGFIKNRIGLDKKTRSDRNVTIDPYVVDGDTVLFLANYPSGGWEIFSNNRSLPMSFASSNEGFIRVPSDTSENIMDAYIISLANGIKTIPEKDSYGDWRAYSSTISNEELQYLSNNVNRASTTSNEEWPIVVSHDSVVGRGGWVNPVLVSETIDTIVYVPHFMRTHWHQREPWNSFIPYGPDGEHMLVGCSAVAVGQYLYYTHQTYGKPSVEPSIGIYHSATNSYSFSNLSNTIWSEMALHDYDTVRSSDSTAVVLGHIAWAINTSFGSNGSSASIINILRYLDRVGFHLSNRCFPNYSTISTLIRQHRPLILELGSSNSDGHLLVIDAIKKTIVKKTYRYGWLGIDHDGNLTMEFDSHGQVSSYKYISYETVSTEEEQVQMNWGWETTYFGSYDNVWYSLVPSTVWSAGFNSFDSQNVWLLDF